MSIELVDNPDLAAEPAPRYVIGIDGSGPSLAALHWGLQRAEHYGAEVVLAHVGDPAVSERSGRLLLEAAAAVATAAHPTLALSSALLAGQAADELARESATASLLVIGTHKTGYLRGRAIGSRSLFIASLAHCSVAIIPDLSLVSRRGIVVGIDPNDDSAEIVRIAALEAERARQYLTVLTADVASRSRPLGFFPTESAAESGTLSLASRRAIRFAPGLEVHSRSSARPASDALLDASRSATLLVLGALVGPVAHDILMNINAPVLIVREHPRAAGAEVPTRSVVGAKA